MIELILPSGVASAELYDDPDGLELFPSEQAEIGRAVEKRRREYTSARHCARRAMAQLGVPAAPVLKGDMGSPQWPGGVVGSMTHCDGYRAAALGFAMQVRSVGIDAEPHAGLPDGVLDATSLPAEREWLAAAGADRATVHFDRLLFCAKEATYKAWFPLTGRWLGFEDAHITFEQNSDGTSGTFHSELLVPGQTHGGPPLSAFDGRWLVRDGLILTAIAVV